jgi:hypothetical protein
MGYDSRLYVIRKTDVPATEDGKFKYAETMAIYEMGVFPPFQMLFNDGDYCPVTEYAPCNGDSIIIKDMYDEPLREASLDDVIECLDQAIVLEEGAAQYARVKPLLALLNGFKKIRNDWYRLSILHYGH